MLAHPKLESPPKNHTQRRYPQGKHHHGKPQALGPGLCLYMVRNLTFKLQDHQEEVSAQFSTFWESQMVKNPPANAGDARDKALIPALGIFLGVGNGNPL